MKTNQLISCYHCGKLFFLKDDDKFFICDKCEIGFDLIKKDNIITILNEFEDYIIVNGIVIRSGNVINFFNKLNVVGI